MDGGVNLNIMITSDALDYIKEKSGVLTIGTTSRKGWVGGSVPLDEVEPETPEDPSSYTKIDKNDISVYIDKKINTDDKTIKITLSKLLWLKKLSLEIEWENFKLQIVIPWRFRGIFL